MKKTIQIKNIKNIKNRKQMEKQSFMIFLLFLLAFKQAFTNHVSNGQFQSPFISTWWADMPTIPSQLCPGWFGHYQLINGSAQNLGTGQCLDMTPADALGWNNMPGYIYQNFTLTTQGFYNVFFRWALYGKSGLLSSYSLTTSFNGVVVNVLNPTVSDVISDHYFLVEGFVGENSILINETNYDPLEVHGFFLDSVIVSYNSPFPTPPAPIINQTAFEPNSDISKIGKSVLPFILLGLGTLPRNLHGLKSAMFIVDDLWLYVYDRRTYSSLMKEIFYTIQQIQTIKWSFFNYYSKIPEFRNHLGISNYSSVTNPKYQEIEELDGSFTRSVALFCVITLPQMLIICVIMKKIFDCLREYELSSFFRRYCFLPNFLQIVFEPNVSYFTYIFFNQIQIFFAYKFGDKCYLAFSVLFWMCVLLFSVCFFCLLNEYYQKHSGYFLQQIYRIPKGIIFATIRINIRGLSYGILHSFLYYEYTELIIGLSIIEFVLLIYSIVLQMVEKVYITRTHFVIGVFYHYLFILLNLTLFYQKKLIKQNDEEQLSIFMQNVVLYILASIMILMMILDFVPIEAFRSSKKSKKQEVEQREQIILSQENIPKETQCIKLERQRKKSTKPYRKNNSDKVCSEELQLKDRQKQKARKRGRTEKIVCNIKIEFVNQQYFQREGKLIFKVSKDFLSKIQWK